MLEGFLHISELEDDYFVYDEKRNIMVGRSTGIIHKSGQPLKVCLERIDLIQLESHWTLCTVKKPRKKMPTLKKEDNYEKTFSHRLGHSFALNSNHRDRPFIIDLLTKPFVASFPQL